MRTASTRSRLQHPGVRWVLVLVLVLASLALVARFLALQSSAPDEESVLGLESDEYREQIEQLDALGYVGGTQAPGGPAGVIVHDAERASAGTNLYTSGHAAEAVLMDMQGAVWHRWSFPFTELRRLRGEPDAEEGMRALDDRRHWRRVHLLPDGELLAIHTHYALIKLDRDSRLVWQYTGRPHHDLDVAEDGRIFVLTNEKHVVPRVNPEREVLEDFVVILDAGGREQKRVSLLECVERAGLAQVLDEMPRAGDLFHTNSIQILDGRHAGLDPAFRKGNVLVSLLTVNTVAVVDLAAERVVWSLRGDFRFQHDATLLDDGRLLLFDNFGPAMRDVPPPSRRGGYRQLWYSYIFSAEKPERPASAVLEIDPISGRVVWAYEGSQEKPFRSEALGAAQRLPNGNTLIVESGSGRAFEVTRGGEIVWEFVSPHRIGGKVARLFDLRRLPPDLPLGWTRAQPERRRQTTASPAAQAAQATAETEAPATSRAGR